MKKIEIKVFDCVECVYEILKILTETLLKMLVAAFRKPPVIL
jgi:hypothetical protein